MNAIHMDILRASANPHPSGPSTHSPLLIATNSVFLLLLLLLLGSLKVLLKYYDSDFLSSNFPGFCIRVSFLSAVVALLFI